MQEPAPYIPGLGIDWLTRYYDPALAAIFQEHRLRMPVIAAMPVLPDQRILDSDF